MIDSIKQILTLVFELIVLDNHIPCFLVEWRTHFG